MSQDAIQRAMEVKRRHEKDLMRKPNVVGVGVGFRTRGGVQSDEVCIVVSVKVKLAPSQMKPGDLIPPSMEGVPVDVVETGEITALDGR